MEISKVQAIDVLPGLYGVYCTVGDNGPLVNLIVHRRWSDDGKKIWFMLESFNFVSARPEQVMEVVETKPLYGEEQMRKFLEEDRTNMAKRPRPTYCEKCGQRTDNHD